MDEASEEVDPVYVIDELELREGGRNGFLEALERDYRPGAEARGQHLVHTWITPPIDSKGVPVRVMLVWRLDGIQGFWTMRSQNSGENVVAFWRDVERFVASRTRRYAASPKSVARFEAIGRMHA